MFPTQNIRGFGPNSSSNSTFSQQPHPPVALLATPTHSNSNLNPCAVPFYPRACPVPRYPISGYGAESARFTSSTFDPSNYPTFGAFGNHSNVMAPDSRPPAPRLGILGTRSSSSGGTVTGPSLISTNSGSSSIAHSSTGFKKMAKNNNNKNNSSSASYHPPPIHKPNSGGTKKSTASSLSNSSQQRASPQVSSTNSKKPITALGDKKEQKQASAFNEKSALRQFENACKNHNLKKIKSAVAGGLDVNVQFQSQSYPLHAAVQSFDCVKFLLEKGATVRKRQLVHLLGDKDRLREEVTANHLKIADLLLQHGASANTFVVFNKELNLRFPLLYLAITKNSIPLAELLFKHGAARDLSHRNELGRCSPLMNCASNFSSPFTPGSSPIDRLKLLVLMLENASDKDLKVVDGNGRTLLDYISTKDFSKTADRADLKEGQHEMIKGLVRGGDNLNKKIVCPKETTTAFLDIMRYSIGKHNSKMLVEGDDQWKFIKWMLKSGRGDINIADHRGETPLFYSVSYSHFAAFKLLVSYNGDITCEDKSGKKPLSHALMKFFGQARPSSYGRYLSRLPRAYRSTTRSTYRILYLLLEMSGPADFIDLEKTDSELLNPALAHPVLGKRLDEFIHRVPSLQHLCRLSYRKSLPVTSVADHLAQLVLPVPCQKFLLYEREIKEIEAIPDDELPCETSNELEAGDGLAAFLLDILGDDNDTDSDDDSDDSVGDSDDEDDISWLGDSEDASWLDDFEPSVPGQLPDNMPRGLRRMCRQMMAATDGEDLQESIWMEYKMTGEIDEDDLEYLQSGSYF